jgi:hypothetical protein
MVRVLWAGRDSVFVVRFLCRFARGCVAKMLGGMLWT